MIWQRHMAAASLAAQVAGDSLALVEDLDDLDVDPAIHLLPDQAEGLRIPRAINLDMIVWRYPRALSPC